MSTVMYAYKVSQKDLWETLKNIRNFYQENHAAFLLVKKLNEAAKPKETIGEQYFAAVDRISKQFTVTFQMFLIDNEWYFRVLSSDYFFMNNHTKFNVTPVWYDNRTDIPEECKDNEKYADIMETMIYNKQYFLCPIVDKDILETFSVEDMFPTK